MQWISRSWWRVVASLFLSVQVTPSCATALAPKGSEALQQLRSAVLQGDERLLIKDMIGANTVNFARFFKTMW